MSKPYKSALDYCTDDLKHNLNTEELEAALNDWEEFCKDMKKAFQDTIAILEQEKEEDEETDY